MNKQQWLILSNIFYNTLKPINLFKDSKMEINSIKEIMNIHNYIKVFILVIIAIISGCRSADPCPENPAIGNIGSIINTKLDDRLPIIVNDTLFFTATREDINPGEQIYKSYLSKRLISQPIMDISLPLQNYPNTGSPSFYYDEYGYNELYFASVAPGDRRGNRDIFKSVFRNGKWATPLAVKELNTEHYESHPFVSKDGSVIVFSSDRPGGYGQTDLYMSKRLPDGSWSVPKNLGESVNTPFEEISPMIDPIGNLYFASKGYQQKSGYDIIKAYKMGDFWDNPLILPFPINTEFDETGPAVWQDKLILSSNRRGGCGGYDIYFFENCGPVFIEGKIDKTNSPVSLAGVFEIVSKSGEILETHLVNADGSFQFPLTPFSDYTLRYVNDCLPDIEIAQPVIVPCSDTSTVKMILNLPLPPEMDIFYLEQKNLPFFVTGYYLPNTTENLEALRLKFSYNLIGNHDSTRYIERPGKEYDEYARAVDRVMKDAENFILKKSKYLQGKCLSAKAMMKIKVNGFADPRPIGKASKYDGIEINDSEFGIQVSRGTAMDNDLLSLLRAYYTAKELQNRLIKYDDFFSVRKKIRWEVSGKGVDTREALSNDLRRRVSLEVGIEE